MDEEKIKEILDEGAQQQKHSQKRPFWNNKKTVKGKALSAWIIVMITIFMLFTFGIGIYLGKEVFSDKKNNNTSNDNTNTNTTDIDEIKNVEIKSVKDEIINGTYDDNNISIEVGKEISEFADGSKEYTIIKSVSINNKKVLVGDGLQEIRNIYKIEDNYLISTHGTDINTLKYHLYSEDGTLIQTLYELDEDGMIIYSAGAETDSIINSNVIEVYGTKLTHGPSLMRRTPEYKVYYLCDENALKEAGVDDSYVVRAKYQLVYNSGKFSIKKISGTEETLGMHKESCNN